MKRTRKLMCLLLALLFVGGLLPAAAPIHVHAATSEDACPSSPSGEHNWILYEHADCTSGGTREYQCSYCYAVRDSVWVDALGHDWGEWITRKEPTCTTTGTRFHQCNRCHTSETETVAALGHSYSATVTSQPSCTAAGEQSLRCTRCGDSYTEAIPALGHDWVTETVEPQGMTDGRRVTTCRRCGETETESIPAAPVIFGTVRNYPPEAANVDYNDLYPVADIDLSKILHITRNPEGGVLPNGGMLTLTVAAEGGYGEYSYEWHYAAADFAAASMGIAQARADQIAAQYQTQRNGYASELGGFFQNKNPAFGTVYKPTYCEAQDSGAENYGGTTGKAMPVTFDWNDMLLGASDGPDYPATMPGEYWCVVTDEAGDKAVSLRATVGSALHIVSQPRNTNIHGQTQIILSCVAAGGTPFQNTDSPYIYAWFAEDGTSLGSYVRDAEITEPGRYYCLVQDDAGERVTSQIAEVYDVEWLTVTAEKSFYPLTDGQESVEIAMSVAGGVPPYNCEWWRDGELISSFSMPGPDVTGGPVSEPGAYFLTVTDTMENYQVGTCAVGEPEKLHITNSGAIGSLDTNNLTLHVAVEGGVPPYSYYLYREDELVNSREGNELQNIDFNVEEPGVYRFHVEDARGDTDDTAPIPVVGDGKPIITKQPESITLEYREDGKYMVPLSCEAISATGDNKKLLYEWEACFVSGTGWAGFYHGRNSISPTFSAEDLQRFHSFRCKVTDKATGEYTYTDIATASLELSVQNLAIDVGKKGYYLTGEIVGGAAPYTAVIHERRIADQTPNENNTYDNVYLDSAFTARTYDSAGPFSEFVTEKITYDYYVKADGSYLRQNTSFEYYIVVTDSLGAIYETSTVRNGRA